MDRIACFCGSKKRCKICGGTGMITFKQCPASIAADPEIRSAVKYFYFWKQTFRYPDDGAIIEQPVALVMAFDFMSRIAGENEARIRENEARKAKNKAK